MEKIFLTGPPGCGKTTIIQKVLPHISCPVDGFYTSEIREHGRRVGFKIQGISGAEDIMAHCDFTGPHRVGKYGVNVTAFERIGIPALDTALHSAKLVIMDEIGRMELFSKKFQEKVLEVLNSNTSIIGVLHQHHNPFTDAIRRRTDIEIIHVTPENRNALPDQILRKLG